MPEEGPVAGPAGGPGGPAAGDDEPRATAGEADGAAGTDGAEGATAANGGAGGVGSRFRHPAPEPLEGPVVATITGGTIIWAVLFLAQLPFYGWFDDHGHLWWLWTCLAGAGLGSFGIWYVRGRDAAIKRHRAAAAQEPPAG